MTDQNKAQSILVHEATLNQVLTYLGSRPFVEVYQLIRSLEAAVLVPSAPLDIPPPNVVGKPCADCKCGESIE